MELSGSWCDDQKPTFFIKQEFSYCLIGLNRACFFLYEKELEVRKLSSLRAILDFSGPEDSNKIQIL